MSSPRKTWLGLIAIVGTVLLVIAAIFYGLMQLPQEQADRLMLEILFLAFVFAIFPGTPALFIYWVYADRKDREAASCSREEFEKQVEQQFGPQ